MDKSVTQMAAMAVELGKAELALKRQHCDLLKAQTRKEIALAKDIEKRTSMLTR